MPGSPKTAPLSAFIAGLALLAALLISRPTTPVAHGATAPPVPVAYQGLYNSMQSSLNAFGALYPGGTRTNHPIYGASLATASGMMGSALLTNPYALNGVDAELSRLKALGVQGVTLNIPYPLLLPSFAQSAQYLQFFETVAQHVKQQGMKLAIEQGITMPGLSSTFPTFTYPSFCTYEQQERQIMQLMIDNLAPAYLSLTNEPGSLYHLTNYSEFNPKTPQTTISYVSYLVGAASDPSCPGNAVTPLRKGATLIGAGQGSWEKTDYAQAYATIKQLDAIDLHIYPLVQSTYLPFQQNIATITNDAKAAGKKITITEMWDTKAQLSDFAPPNLGHAIDMQKRDNFSFWQPLDSQFLTEIGHYAATNPVLYLSPFWSLYFEGYLTYTPGVYDENSSAQVLYSADQALQAQNMANGGPFTATALAYKAAIAAP